MKRKMKVVVVDDELQITDLLDTYLSCISRNLDILQFNDPSEARNFLLQNIPDILITDFKMPMYDGIQLMKMCSRHTTKVLISGYVSEITENMLNELNGSFFEKPVPLKELGRIVKDVELKIELENDLEINVDIVLQPIFIKDCIWLQFLCTKDGIKDKNQLLSKIYSFNLSPYKAILFDFSQIVNVPLDLQNIAIEVIKKYSDAPAKFVIIAKGDYFSRLNDTQKNCYLCKNIEEFTHACIIEKRFDLKLRKKKSKRIYTR